MKNIILVLIIFSFFSNEILSQVVYGKLVDENGTGLAGIQLQLYTTQNFYYAISDSDGTFAFNNVTVVEDKQLPIGYSVSDNFPNPFNPRTRIGITLPVRENVKVEVFNLLGQSVVDVIEEIFDAGTNYIDIELNGLPNGFYISRITINNKFTVVKKLMLIYGSQHLISSGSQFNKQLNKLDDTCLEINLDSLVATSAIVGRKTYTGLPNFVGGTLDLGIFTIIRYCPGTPTIQYAGKTYHTIQIGNQCWLKENLDVGMMIQGNQEATNNYVIEKYCYDNDPNNFNTYGGLYQWNEAMQYVTTQGTQGICPTGWHIPTLTEFETLSVVVTNGNALKEIGQGTGGGAGTNTSGFTALLAGFRYTYGSFNELGVFAHFWSSSEFNPYSSYSLYLKDDWSYAGLGFSYKYAGFCIRCVKD